jgi:hypothetical protein
MQQSDKNIPQNAPEKKQGRHRRGVPHTEESKEKIRKALTKTIAPLTEEQKEELKKFRQYVQDNFELLWENAHQKFYDWCKSEYQSSGYNKSGFLVYDTLNKELTYHETERDLRDYLHCSGTAIRDILDHLEEQRKSTKGIRERYEISRYYNFD